MPNTDLANGIWISLSELARQKNISRSSAKEHVDRLEAKGLVETRRQGRERVVNLATYNHAVGAAGDVAKEIAAADRRSMPVAGGAYRDAQTQKAQYEAQLKSLELAERRRALLPIAGPDGVAAAAVAIAAAVTSIMDALPSHADRLASVVASGGVNAARVALRDIGRDMRTRAAVELQKLADTGREAEASGSIVTDLFADPDTSTASHSAN